jgi:4-amino-4-deoxy-L-arabinose transferase-like glycosyltransferase
MAGRGVNDHLAGLIVTAFAASMVLVTFAIGRAIFTIRIAWLSTILLLSSPLFVDWSTSGYVDVPVGVYHGLTFLFAFLWMESGERRTSVLTGAMAGLALWTKQSALVLILIPAVVPMLRGWPRRNVKSETFNMLAALGTMTLFAGPWYLRNLIFAGPGQLLPTPGAYDAQFIDRSLQSLLTFAGDIGEWGPWFSCTAIIGILLWLVSLIRLRPHENKPVLGGKLAILLAAFILPYHLIWWQGFSYQTRYLLASAPMYATLAGCGADWMIQKLPIVSRMSRWAIIMLVSILVFLGSYKRMGAVYHLVIHPFQTDDAKLTRLVPEEWTLVKHIRETIEPGSHILVMDGTLAYWLHEYQLHQGYPTYLNDLQGYDYFVTSAAGGDVYRFYGTNKNEVMQNLGEQEILPEVYRHNESIAVYQIMQGAP